MVRTRKKIFTSALIMVTAGLFLLAHVLVSADSGDQVSGLQTTFETTPLNVQDSLDQDLIALPFDDGPDDPIPEDLMPEDLQKAHWAPLYSVAREAGTTNYYVDITNGNDDNNDGSEAAPWKTFHHAIGQINNAASGRYALIMGAGTYSIANGEATAALILSQSRVAIFGADDHAIGADTTTLIDGTGTSVWDWVSGINTTGSNITIRGVSITNFSATGHY